MALTGSRRQFKGRAHDTGPDAIRATKPRSSSASRLFGYDMFISFALGPPPRGTQSYGSDLARRLRERDFTVFFSEDEAAPGSPLTSTLRSALHRSRVLVVIANRGTLTEPRWVRTEIEEFRRRHPRRPIIPISVGGALQDADLSAQTEAWLGHRQTIWLDETSEAVDRGIASDGLVDRLVLAPGQVRSNVRWRRVVGAVIAGLVLLTISSIAAAVYAVRQRDEAVRQNALAQASRLAAQSDLLRERGAAATGYAGFDNSIDASALLAAEAVRTLEAFGERSLEVDLTLRRSLSQLPQVLGRLENLSGGTMRLSPNADFVVATNAAGGEVTVGAVADGEARGCRRDDIRSETVTDNKALRLVRAASSDGAWCVVQQFDRSHSQTLEVWSSRPARRVGRFAADSRDGHIYTAISDDGQVVAVTDRAQMAELPKSTLRLWSLIRHDFVLRAVGEEFLAFSPDGRHLATTAGLYRVALDTTGRPKRVLSWASPPWHLAFSRDGAFAATRLDHEGPVEIWNVAAERREHTTPAPTGAVLAVDSAARRLIIATRDGAQLWNIRDEQVRGSVPLEAKAAAFGPAGPTLLVERFDRQSLTPVYVMAMTGWGSAMTGLDIDAADGRVAWLGIRGEEVDVLIDESGTLRLDAWLPRSGTRRTDASMADVGAWAVSADGTRLAMSVGAVVSIREIGRPGSVVEVRQPAPPALIALSADGRYLAATAGRTIRVSLVGTNDVWHSPELPDVPGAIKLSRDGVYGFATVVTGEPGRSGPPYALFRWRLAGPPDLKTIGLGSLLTPPSLCAVSDDGLSVLTREGVQSIASASGRLVLASMDETDCAAAARRPWRVTSGEESVVVSDTHGGRAVARLDHPARVAFSAASADGRSVVTVDENGTLRVFAIEATDLIRQVCARAPFALTVEQWNEYLGPAIAADVCGRPRPEE